MSEPIRDQYKNRQELTPKFAFEHNLEALKDPLEKAIYQAETALAKNLAKEEVGAEAGV